MAKYGPKIKPLADRFWPKVEVAGKDECWPWTGSVNADGYGVIFPDPVHIERQGRQLLRAHRVSWQLHYGEIPDGLSVLHKCDNPPCVNPKHLYVGTQQDNVRDRRIRKRGKEARQQGAANDNARLTEKDVKKIIVLLKAEKSQAAIAVLFGVHQTHVSRISRRETWKHLWEGGNDTNHRA